MEDRILSDKKKSFIKSRRHEVSIGSFQCSHCGRAVPLSEEMGTSHRNHCDVCLWSKHVDGVTPGDRKSDCHTSMKPIGITLKTKGTDKYTGEARYGDVMLIHKCAGCYKININRIAADDNTDAIMNVFEKSQTLSVEDKKELENQDIDLFDQSRRSLIEKRLFGKIVSSDSL